MATEKRLISLDEALKATHGEVFWTESEQAAVRSFLVKRPTVEVKHGRWHEVPYIDKIACSVCGQHWSIKDNCTETFNYCPNCGADMRERKDNGL